MKTRFHAGLALCRVLLLGLAPAAFPQGGKKAASGDFTLIRDAAQSLAAGDLKRAENELNIVLAAAPDDVRALNLLGIVYAQQKRESEAEELFKRAIALKPDFASAHVSLGMLYVQTAKPDEAILEFQSALRLEPSRPDAMASLMTVWREQARTAVGQGDPEKALSLLLQARKANPKEGDVLFDFGMVALRMSLFPDAAQAFRETLDLRRDDANALYGLGRAQMGLANYADARATFERFVRLRPSDASGHYALGMTLQALERSAEARSEFAKSIELQPAQTESYFRLGRIDLEAGDLSAAEQQFIRVLKRDPRHAGSLAGMGRLKFRQKEYSQALDMLAKAVAADPSLREAHYYLGMAYARMNRKDESEKELAIAGRLEHEEVERHQSQLKIIDADQTGAAHQNK